MRRTVNIVMFRVGVSLLGAVSMIPSYAHPARSQTADISQLPAIDSNSQHRTQAPARLVENIQNLGSTIQKNVDDDILPTTNQLVDNRQESISLINETASERGDLTAKKQLEAIGKINKNAENSAILPAIKPQIDNNLSPQNQQNFNFLAQNSQTEPRNLPAPPTGADPNRDRFLQPTQPPSPEPPPAPPQIQPPSPQPLPQPLPSDLIQVQKIQVVGSTILNADEIKALVNPLEGRSATLEQLKQVADKITEIYLNRGYITSRAVLPPQTITAGVVQIQVIEGKLSKIEVEGTKRLHPAYIRSRIRLGAGMPLSTASLEDQLRLLRVDPLFDNVEARLRAGDNEGESILIVRVSEANPFQASVSIDNYSPPSVGSERLGVSLRHRNITGNGDELAAAYYRSIGDSDVFDFSYRIPLNAMNGTLQLRAAPNRNSIVQAPFDAFDISGKSHLFEVSYRQPLVRSPIEEFALSGGLTYQTGRTFVEGKPTPFGFGPDSNGVSTTTAIKLGQDYVRRDPQGAWALRSQFTIGTSLLDATSNEGSVPDGQFLSWLGQVQRVQRLNNQHLLIVQADLQLSANSLLSSQQFVIGGGQSLRGYRQNVRSGDNGVRFSIEDRITLKRDASGIPKLQLAPFFDAGTVWNVPNNPNKLTNQTFLAGLGLGVLWEPIPRVNVRLEYALPLVRISDRGDNLQDSGIYFNIIYTP